MSKKDDRTGAGRSESRRDRQGRFLPGESGNRQGRPRKTRNGELNLLEIMMKPIAIRQADGTIKKMPFLEVHINKMMDHALRGDRAAAKDVTTIMGKLGMYDASKRAQVQQYDAQKDYDKLMAILDEKAERQKEEGEAED